MRSFLMWLFKRHECTNCGARFRNDRDALNCQMAHVERLKAEVTRVSAFNVPWTSEPSRIRRSAVVRRDRYDEEYRPSPMDLGPGLIKYFDEPTFPTPGPTETFHGFDGGTSGGAGGGADWGGSDSSSSSDSSGGGGDDE